jgi:hypothetical protein
MHEALGIIPSTKKNRKKEKFTYILITTLLINVYFLSPKLLTTSKPTPSNFNEWAFRFCTKMSTKNRRMAQKNREKCINK